MSIVVPIMFAAVLLGLFVPRMTKGWWYLLAGFILLVLLYNYLKPTVVPAAAAVGLLRKSYAISVCQS